MLTEADYLGARAIIDGRYKLVLHERKNGEHQRELFDLEADPAEKSNLIGQEPEITKRLQTGLGEWQESVLHSLTGADYPK